MGCLPRFRTKWTCRRKTECTWRRLPRRINRLLLSLPSQTHQHLKGETMNAPWKLICLILALVLFAISAWAYEPTGGQWHGRFIAAGLFFFTLSMIIS